MSSASRPQRASVLRQQAARQARVARRETDPEAVQEHVSESLTVPLEGPPQIALEEFQGSEVVVRIRAAPVDPSQGGALAREVLRAVDEIAATAAAA